MINNNWKTPLFNILMHAYTGTTISPNRVTSKANFVVLLLLHPGSLIHLGQLTALRTHPHTRNQERRRRLIKLISIYRVFIFLWRVVNPRHELLTLTTPPLKNVLASKLMCHLAARCGWCAFSSKREKEKKKKIPLMSLASCYDELVSFSFFSLKKWMNNKPAKPPPSE